MYALYLSLRQIALSAISSWLPVALESLVHDAPRTRLSRATGGGEESKEREKESYACVVRMYVCVYVCPRLTQ